MNGYHIATHLLGLMATATLAVAWIWGPMPWWVFLGGTIAINLVVSSYTKTKDESSK